MKISILIPMLFLTGMALASDNGAMVYQNGQLFSMDEVTIKVGEAVTFVNDDDQNHTVLTYIDDRRKSVGLQKPGEINKLVFPVAGTFEVYCGIHPRMMMMVNVTED